jgi:hypothetical protein
MGTELFSDNAAEMNAIELEMDAVPYGDGAAELNAVGLDANTG